MKVVLQIQKDLKRRLIDGRLSICNTCTVKLCIAAFANDALTSKYSCNPVLKKKKKKSMFVLLANTLFQHSKPQNHSNAVIVLLASKNTTIEKLSNLLPVCSTVVFHL